MTDFFCHIYSSITPEHKLLEKIRINSLLRVLIRYSANLLLPLYYSLTGNNEQYKINPNNTRKKPLVVSLSSFPKRIDRVWLVIETMLRQTVKPDRIILWLSKLQFSNIDQLPNSLKRLQKRGVEIQLTDDDYRSHRKYFYAIQQMPDADIFTIDDDIFYPSFLIEETLNTAKTHPCSVICNYSHDIRHDSQGNLLPYKEWNINVTHGHNLFFGSGGGTLFPPGSLHNDVTDITTAMLLCPTADDIWLNCMVRINNTHIYRTNLKQIVLPIINLNNETLSNDNIEYANDKQIANIRKYCIDKYGRDPFSTTIYE